MEKTYEEIEKDEDEHEEYLNEIFGEIDVCGMQMDAGRILREIDPIAFRCSMADMPILYRCLGCDAIYEDEDEAENCCPEKGEEGE